MRPRHRYVAGLRLVALCAAAQGAVGWRYSGRGVSYQVWHCGDPAHDAPLCTYRTMTPQCDWLLAEGLIRRESGFQFGRGYVEVTVKGWEELGRLAEPVIAYLCGWRLGPR